jgi:hypothetical protein
MGLLLYGALLLLFATWTTAHVLLCLRLATVSWLKALAGLVLFPLAGYYGQEHRFSKLTAVWVVSLTAYLVALLIGAVYGDLHLHG